MIESKGAYTLKRMNWANWGLLVPNIFKYFSVTPGSVFKLIIKILINYISCISKYLKFIK